MLPGSSLSSELPVVALFTGSCHTCREAEDVWDLFVSMHRGKAVFVKVKKELAGEIFFKSGVHWIPTVVFYLGNKELGRIETYITLEDLERWLDRLLRRANSRVLSEIIATRESDDLFTLSPDSRPYEF